MSDSAEAREWHRIIRASVRECLETWRLQASGGPVTVEALEAILARATVLILRQLEGRPRAEDRALARPGGTMLAAFVEVSAEHRRQRHARHDLARSPPPPPGRRPKVE